MTVLRKILAGLSIVVVLCVGCDTPKTHDTVLTQKITPGDRIQVTVLVKHAFQIDEFERIAEQKFPRLDLIQVGNFTKDRGIIEYSRRLEHDDLTDIIMTWPLEVGEDYWKDRLLDLSGMPFTSRYNVSILNTIAREDGKLYYLPGPAQVRGIVYNKTLFEEKGWQVPADFESFIRLCKQIEATGIRSIQLGFSNAEVLDTAFIGFSYGNCFSTPADGYWLSNYNKGEGRFQDQFKPALDTFQRLIDEGIWKKNDLHLDYSQREEMLFTRKCAMIEDSVLMARLGFDRTGTRDVFALMPFQNPGTPSDWARLYMVCYIGLNKHLAEPQNQAKYELVLDLMQYISTPEGQTALAADTGAMLSSVKKVPPPDVPEINDLLTTLRAGRAAIFPELARSQGALRQGLAGMIAGTHTKEDVMQLVDQRNANPTPKATQEVIGQATADFTLIETGNFVTDAMRAKTGASIALFLDDGKDGNTSGKGITARLYKGPQTADDVFRIMPDIRYGATENLQLITMTGRDLLRTLEHSITVDHGPQGWFYYFSGLRMEYAPAAEPGSRIRKVTDTAGNPIDLQRAYTVAIMEHTVPANAISSRKDIGITMTELVTEAIRTQQTISPSADGRFVIREP